MRPKSQAGSNLIEFALVLPLLLILVFGIIDFGIALYDKAIITNASREGARAGIVLKTPRLTRAEVEAIAANYCGGKVISFGASATCAATATGAGGPSGADLTVNVTYPYSFSIVGILIPSLNSITLSSSTVMKME